jgi:hypothetical protein
MALLRYIAAVGNAAAQLSAAAGRRPARGPADPAGSAARPFRPVRGGHRETPADNPTSDEVDTMSDVQNQGAAMGEYHRAVLSAAQDQVVAEAERTVCLEWTVELARMRRQARLGCAAAEFVRSAAHAGVRAQQWTGDIGALALAHSRLEVAEAEVSASIEAEQAVAAATDDALGRMLRAHGERENRLRANQSLVRSAWNNALGEVLAGGRPAGSAVPEPSGSAEPGEASQ